MMVDTCPQKLLCSISLPIVVLKRASSKQIEKALFTNLKRSSFAKLLLSFFRTVISNSI